MSDNRPLHDRINDQLHEAELSGLDERKLMALLVIEIRGLRQDIAARLQVGYWSGQQPLDQPQHDHS